MLYFGESTEITNSVNSIQRLACMLVPASLDCTNDYARPTRYGAWSGYNCTHLSTPELCRSALRSSDVVYATGLAE